MKLKMTDNRKPKPLDRLRQIIRIKYYSLRTEESYADWIKRFTFLHDKKHPIEMGEEDLHNEYGNVYLPYLISFILINPPVNLTSSVCDSIILYIASDFSIAALMYTN